jgi:hypothetical protein
MATGIACILQGCGDSTGPTATGSLEVTVTTSGSMSDPDSVEVVIDNQVHASVVGGHAVITGIATGQHSIELGGVAPVCDVTTDNPVRVDIRAGAPTSIAFAVRCLERATILVSVTTQGTNAPGLTYTVELDRNQARAVSSTGQVTFEKVQGPHSVLLRGVPAYCLIGGFDLGPNPVSVTVRAGEVEIIPFRVLCLG